MPRRPQPSARRNPRPPRRGASAAPARSTRRLPRVALAAGAPAARAGVLRDLTLALVADLPDDLARTTLARWASAPGGSDRDARVSLLRRTAAMPRAGDPDRAERVAELSSLLAADPGHPAARE